jgi:transaldolase
VATPPAEYPVVLSVIQIYNYDKKFDYRTEVIGASFRKTGEITELTGCDLLTIAPALLAELPASTAPLTRKLDRPIEKVTLDERAFRYAINEDAMATEKTTAGSRGFTADILKLEKLSAGKIG